MGRGQQDMPPPIAWALQQGPGNRRVYVGWGVLGRDVEAHRVVLGESGRLPRGEPSQGFLQEQNKDERGCWFSDGRQAAVQQASGWQGNRLIPGRASLLGGVEGHPAGAEKRRELLPGSQDQAWGARRGGRAGDAWEAHGGRFPVLPRPPLPPVTPCMSVAFPADSSVRLSPWGTWRPLVAQELVLELWGEWGGSG